VGLGEEEEREEGEIADDIGGIPWDDLVEEDEPGDNGSSSRQQVQGDANLSSGNLPLGRPFSRHVKEAQPSEPTKVGSSALFKPLERVEGQKWQHSHEERLGPGGPVLKYSNPVAPR
jgi:hypothetical protein